MWFSTMLWPAATVTLVYNYLNQIITDLWQGMKFQECKNVPHTQQRRSYWHHKAHYTICENYESATRG